MAAKGIDSTQDTVASPLVYLYAYMLCRLRRPRRAFPRPHAANTSSRTLPTIDFLLHPRLHPWRHQQDHGLFLLTEDDVFSAEDPTADMRITYST